MELSPVDIDAWVAYFDLLEEIEQSLNNAEEDI